MNVDGNELANIDMRKYRYKNVTKKFHIVGKISKLQDPEQGLTQTFLSSGPQDHQLRESGGPTIFLGVLRIKSRHTNSYAYIIKKWVGKKIIIWRFIASLILILHSYHFDTNWSRFGNHFLV